ncbi:GNAT family N-acetyltransferase [Filobacillus milosensis]|uniref:GNAT family N-acetyltransferase n=1 Tax=Filobacillus milosensis TaxID=94137 RepID=A0A4Y8IFD3_9BACI|nr:GNAT family N-acetyltransferase [Filobacillus milosensis]TFB18476.1 GNAT family N-acetyltransferase [Filobacillus milosensis]
MHELKLEDFNTINHLLDTDYHFPEIRAVVEGNQPGWVFVDRIEEPHTAMIFVGEANGFMFVGEIIDEFLQGLNPFIEEVIKPRLLEDGINYFECSGSSPKWNQALKNELIKNWYVKEWECLLFEFKEAQFDLEKSLSHKQVRKVNEALLEDRAIENRDWLLEVIKPYWRSMNDFYDKGIGYVVIDDNQIVSVCHSCYVAGDVYKVDIVTLKDYRKKGYARLVAQAYIADCLANDKVPYWDCMIENVASHKLAESLGFEVEDVANYYDFYFKQDTID